MDDSRRARSRRDTGRRTRRVVLVAAIAVVAVGLIAIPLGMALGSAAKGGSATTEAPLTTSTSPAATPTPTPTPRTATQQLLATSSDPNACAVSFAGDGITVDPELETQGVLYLHLPIPKRDGAVFAGWYPTPSDAAALTVASRVNGSQPVVCTDHETILYGGWVTPEANVAEDARIPIMMYHQFTTNPDGEQGWLRGNYAYIGDFEAAMDHIATTGFYLPTWDELSAFIDGRLYLPNHSVIITDDDCDLTWLNLAMPIAIEKKLLVTAFCITVDGTGPSPSPYILQRSHTHDMHKAGANGKGRMVNWTVDQIAADMETSAQVLGVKQVMAYPFGHYDDTAKEGLRKAGFEMARTIDPGYVTIGTDKLALPAVRINYGMKVDEVGGLIG